LAKQLGITLIEVLVFIVVVSVGVVGLLSTFQITVKSSADPMVQKQLVAVAESLLDEILAQPIAGDGVRPSGGATQANRAAGNLDEVDDYDGFATTGIYALDGVSVVSGLSAYSVSVSVNTAATLGGVAARLVQVVVSGNGELFKLSGYKTNYAE
jgi:MSHA pilin protein MshD